MVPDPRFGVFRGIDSSKAKRVGLAYVCGCVHTCAVAIRSYDVQRILCVNTAGDDYGLVTGWIARGVLNNIHTYTPAHVYTVYV